MQSERPRTWVEVDLGRIKRNYRTALRLLNEMQGASAQDRERAAPASCQGVVGERPRPQGQSEIIAVVKSNAYGHGDARVARALYDCGVRRFAVANVDEAAGIRKRTPLGEDCEILILGYTPPSMVGLIDELGLTQTLVSGEYASELAQRTFKSRIKCHLAIDTGMRRIGIDSRDAAACAEITLKHSARLDIRAIFTHLCAADGISAEDRAFTAYQIEEFKKIHLAMITTNIMEAHCLNSAGVLMHAKSTPPALRRLVRPGMLLYGIAPCSADPPPTLLPALGWRTDIAMLKKVRKGESIGYGRAFVAPRDMLVATLPVGYADGYPRALSSTGYVLIGDAPAPILGRVCMNQMMVDAGRATEADLAKGVTLIGASLKAERLATLAGTISYEILSRIDASLPRVYKDE